MKFTGRTAVITGGGAVIGRKPVRQLFAEGCNVAIYDVFPDGMAETKRLSQLERPHEAVRITTHTSQKFQSKKSSVLSRRSSESAVCAWLGIDDMSPDELRSFSAQAHVLTKPPTTAETGR
ncbi:NAD(P)-dependent dehydrogenase (short-subunit alcohol dehydrogenase family) [Bradyrhizobium sp. GM0.4]